MQEYVDQLLFAGEDNFWYPAMDPLLQRVEAEQACWTPVEGGNSIWQIVHHVAYSYTHAAGRLRGNEPEWREEENWVPNPERVSGETWAEEVARLRAARADFARAIRELAGQDLSAPCGKLTRRDHIVQVIQHEAYHAGQVAYIQRLLGYRPIM